MKTSTLIPTLLVLAIQVMVNGQTPRTQVRKIRMDIMGQPKQQNMQPSIKKELNVATTQNKQKQNELHIQFGKQERFTDTLNPLTKGLVFKIKHSEVLAQRIYQKFSSNMLIINIFFYKDNSTSATRQKAYEINSNANQAFKMAKEIREEAYNQLTLEAVVSEISNAEENERIAIEKQMQVLELFEKINIKLLNDIALQRLPENSLSMNTNSLQNKTSTPINTTSKYELLVQQKNIFHSIEMLKSSVITANETNKQEILNEIKELELDVIKNKITYSNQKSLATYASYNNQLVSINATLETQKIPSEIKAKINTLLNEAANAIKMGKEIREEANAQLTPYATLGELSNAEEKENNALQYQRVVLSSIGISSQSSSLAIK